MNPLFARLPPNSRLQRTTRAVAHDSLALAAALALVAAEPQGRYTH
jgi:hypothetical protein